MTIMDEAKARIRDFRIAERERLEAVVKEQPPYTSEYKKMWLEKYELLTQEVGWR